MALHLFGKPRRRSRSSGMGKGVETVMTIAAIGALGVGAYFVLSSGDARGTVGRWMKNATDAFDSTGDWIGDGSYWLQKQLGIGATGGGGSSSSSKDEPKGIVKGLQDSAGEYFDWYKKGVAKEIQENEDRSLINRKGISDFFMGLGCGVIRKC